MKRNGVILSKEPMVWIISQFAGGPSYCPRIPDYSLAKYLREHGYDALVFAGSALHNSDVNFIQDGDPVKKEIVDGVPFVYVKTRSYTGRKGEALSFVDFYRNLMKNYKKFGRPDIVMAAMPQPLNCLAGYKIAKKCKVPFITDVVDLWPLSIVEYADFSDNNPAIKAMYSYEKWLYEKSDALVFSWEGAYDYIIDQGWNNKVPKDKFNYINIGVDLKGFYDNLEQYKVEDPDLEDDKFRVMYCGSVRTANDIGTVVESAKKLNERGYEDKIRFIIYGDGPDRAVLEKKCEDGGIGNVVFKGNIEKKYIPYVLSKSNLNILNLKSAKTQKYGNSSNKLFEYLAAGNPVIANIDEGNYPIISRYGCGKVVTPNSPTDYADGIEYFYNLGKGELETYKENAKATAKLFDTEEMNAKWESVIRRLLEGKRQGQR
ncbi:MAG: glycosyltransferase family 4 protein [Firmicutes bacterium]|nr:glycosyltransferase family 4 protein [Bacillota bacterium]